MVFRGHAQPLENPEGPDGREKLGLPRPQDAGLLLQAKDENTGGV